VTVVIEDVTLIWDDNSC